MTFNNVNDCVEAIAYLLSKLAPDSQWVSARLRASSFDEDDIGFGLSFEMNDSSRYSPKDTPQTLGDWIEELAQLNQQVSGQRFSRMVMVLFSDGRFEARYGYEPLPDNFFELEMKNRLPLDFWP